MAYQALYRVWRSQRFDEIVGQKTITQTLKNAIAQHKTSHAYLFTGPRGTGKTSAAKIFAKAINCPNSVDGEPCNECEVCRSITEGRQEDVVEIDAASNNGVEEIRFIRDRANYAPTQVDYKVYIIDEVHMLSIGAFNALLKTLEEPKERVIFILATTEPHKIPLTIISRTQRFDFKRIGVHDIVEHLEDILKAEKISYEDQALYAIARAAEGGMRDALSILDQAISFSEDTITLDSALQVTGSLTYEMMDQYLTYCAHQDVEHALETLEGILSEGKEAGRFLEDLLLYCRDLLMYQQAPALLEEKHGQLTDSFIQLAKEIQPAQIYRFIQLLNETQNEVRFTNNAGIYLEVVTVKMATPGASEGAGGAVLTTDSADNAAQVPPPAATAADSQELATLKQEVSQLKQEIDHLKANGIGSSGSQNGGSSRQERNHNTKTAVRVSKEKIFQVLKEATKENLNQVRQVWSDLLQTMTASQRALLNASEPIAAGPDKLLVAFDYPILCQRAMNDKEVGEAIQNNLGRMIEGYTPEPVYIPRESWAELRQSYVEFSHQQPQEVADLEPEDEEITLLPQEPGQDIVDEARKLFGDAVSVVDD